MNLNIEGVYRGLKKMVLVSFGTEIDHQVISNESKNKVKLKL